MKKSRSNAESIVTKISVPAIWAQTLSHVVKIPRSLGCDEDDGVVIENKTDFTGFERSVAKDEVAAFYVVVYALPVKG